MSNSNNYLVLINRDKTAKSIYEFGVSVCKKIN